MPRMLRLCRMHIRPKLPRVFARASNQDNPERLSCVRETAGIRLRRLFCPSSIL